MDENLQEDISAVQHFGLSQVSEARNSFYEINKAKLSDIMQ